MIGRGGHLMGIVPNVDCEYQNYQINKKKLSCDTCIYYGTSSCTNKRKREEALKKKGVIFNELIK